MLKQSMEKFKKISIEKAILSYPHLIEREPAGGKYNIKEDERKYKATFIIDKTIVTSKGEVIPNPVVENLKEMIEEIKSLSKLKNLPFDIIKDGDEIYDELEDIKDKKNKEYLRGKYTISGKNRREIKLFIRHNGEITETKDIEKFNNSEFFYPGAIVNAHIEIAAYPYTEGEKKKGLSVFIHAVQFAKHGKMIGVKDKSSVDSSSVFSALSDDEDEDISVTNKSNIDELLF